MSFNIEGLKATVGYVNDAEAHDWEETTREERHWMQELRVLALQVLAFYGHKVA